MALTVLAMVAGCAWSLVAPISQLTAAQAATAAAQQQLADIQQQVWDATATVEQLSSPAGIELRARAQLGYVVPGDILVVLPD